jgi:hypothetical protein
MPSIRLSAVPVLILAALPLAGCGYSRDACWPAGAEAVVSDAKSGIVTARVPRDQRNKIQGDSVMLGSQTPVVIVDDFKFRAMPAGKIWGTSPADPVRVRIVQGRQGIEVLVRRRELAPRPVANAWAVSFVPVFAAAGVLWAFETVVLLVLRMRSDRTRLHLGPLPLQTLATLLWRTRIRSQTQTIERTDEDCERWREWIAEKTARRKAVCARLRARRLHNESTVG